VVVGYLTASSPSVVDLAVAAGVVAGTRLVVDTAADVAETAEGAHSYQQRGLIPGRRMVQIP